MEDIQFEIKDIKLKEDKVEKKLSEDVQSFSVKKFPI